MNLEEFRLYAPDRPYIVSSLEVNHFERCYLSIKFNKN